MAKPMSELVLVVSEVEEPRTGLWCGVCFLPSAIFQRLELRFEHNGRLAATHNYAYCDGHDGRPWPENDEHGPNRWWAEHSTEEV